MMIESKQQLVDGTGMRVRVKNKRWATHTHIQKQKLMHIFFILNSSSIITDDAQTNMR